MKRIALLFVAAMLFSAPAFSADTKYTGGSGLVEANTTKTTVKDSMGMAIGEGSRVQMGGIYNKGNGTVKGNTDTTTVKDSMGMAIGKDSEVQFGGIINK